MDVNFVARNRCCVYLYCCTNTRKAEVIYVMKKRNSTKKKMQKGIVTVIIALAVLAIIGTGTYLYINREKTYAVTDASGKKEKLTIDELKTALDVDIFYPGISINGTDVSGKTKEQVTAMFAADPSLDAPSVNLSLSVQGVTYPVDAASLNISSNLSAIIDEAYNYGRTAAATNEAEALVERYNTVALLSTAPKAYTSSYTADPGAISSAVHAILDPLQREPVDAKASSFDKEALTFIVEESQAGLSLDADKAIADIEAAVNAQSFNQVVEVAATVVEPVMSAADLSANLGLVATTTTETTSDANRNTNISLVCKALDGLVLQPGESFDFNEYVGERTADKGYKEAGGIFDGILRQELGGGICQANGTLFHSVMKADLQVDERNPHSWPSTYVPVGTDATVTWGGANFKFTNNTEYPVAIHAFYADREVTVQIYGRPVADGLKVKIESKIIATTPAGPAEYVADPLLPAGTINPVAIRKAHDAITAECYKVYYDAEGTEVKRELVCTSYYRALCEKIGVGVLAPDGVTLYPLDPKTGIVTMPPVTPAPTDTTAAPTDTAPTAPTETTAAAA